MLSRPRAQHRSAHSSASPPWLRAGQLEALARALAETAPASGADCDREREGRRAQGAYFTPTPLVEFVVAESLRARLADPGLRWAPDGSPGLRVLDPSAGDGRFLAAAVDYLVQQAVRQGWDASLARAAVTRRCVVGIERDPEFAALARDRLGPGARVHCREALLDAPDDAAGVDVVVGNPPYLRSIRFSRQDAALWRALRGRYAATSHGEWDLYAAFIEQALDWVRPGGEIGLVVPSRWLTAVFARKLRDKLARAGAVRAVVDFGATQVFADATTYTSVVFLSRSPTSDVAVARLSGSRWHCGRISPTSLSAEPWRLVVGPDRTLIDRLSRQGPTLGQVARIVKGAGTNADPIYVLTSAHLRGDLVRGISKAEGGPVAIEAVACRPCLRGRDVSSYGEASPAVQCIVPYSRGGELWPPGQLARHRNLAGYLARFRDRLEGREGGRFEGREFYRFGRPQNMAFLGDRRPKIVIPDVARGGRALCDRSGAMVLDSAYAIRLRGDSDHAGYPLEFLLAVLNSPVVGWWLRATGIPLRGGYMRLKTAYLSTLPLPARSATIGQIADLVASRSLADSGEAGSKAELIADLVRQVYGLDRAAWNQMARSRPTR